MRSVSRRSNKPRRTLPAHCARSPNPVCGAGTASELSVVLTATGLHDSPTAPLLSALLRNREPDLYRQRICVTFRRKPGSGERLIEIARR